MANIPTHASTGKIKSSAPGSRTKSSGLPAKGRPAVQKAGISNTKRSSSY